MASKHPHTHTLAYLGSHVLQKPLHDLVLDNVRELAKDLLIVLGVVAQHTVELVQEQLLAVCKVRCKRGFDVRDERHGEVKRLGREGWRPVSRTTANGER